MYDDAEVIGAMLRIARPIILEHFSKPSCIASTRIGIDVLGYFGIKSEPMPLMLMVFNEEALKILDDGKTFEELGEIQRQESPTTPGGPWSIAVGAEVEDSPDWAGHLVVALPHRQMIIDLSIDQASRPLKNLNFDDQPLVYRIPDPDWWTGESRRYATVAQHKDGPKVGLVFDRDAPDANGYKRSSNWNRKTVLGAWVFKDITGRIIREIKEDLSR